MYLIRPFFLLTFFQQYFQTYEEAAAIDGCPPMRTFWKIMFPHEVRNRNSNNL